MYAVGLGINPGDYLNPDGSVSIGLMPAVDNLTASAFAAGKLQNQSAILAGGTVQLPQTSVSCTSNCQGGITTTPPSAGTETIFKPASAPEFSLLGDGVDTNSVQDWISTGNGTSSATLTIPVGIFGVADVSTMLNTVAGLTTGGSVCTGNNGLNPQSQTCTAGSTAAYAYLTLNFSTTATGSTLQSETFALINGLTQANILDGAMAGTSASVSNYTVNYLGQNYTVDATNVWSPKVVSGSANGNESFQLDAQMFPVFQQFQSLYLTSVVITDNGGASTNHEVLSALSITPTPEPSTLLLLGAGLATIGLVRFRKSVKA